MPRGGASKQRKIGKKGKTESMPMKNMPMKKMGMEKMKGKKCH